MIEKSKKLIEEYEQYAAENGFRLNPNKAVVEAIVGGLLKNEKEFGKRYCPCRKIHAEDTVCPCAHHKKEIEEEGHCHCFLFTKKESKPYAQNK